MRKIGAQTSKINSYVMSLQSEGQAANIKDIAFELAKIQGFDTEKIQLSEKHWGMYKPIYNRLMSNARSIMLTLTDCQPNPIHTVIINGKKHWYKNPNYRRR